MITTSKKSRLFARGALAILASCVATGLAQAQEAEDIIVTAQRRAESIDSVPLSVSAFTSQTLEKLGVDRVIDLTAQTPNVGVFTIFGDAQQPSFSIRGISLLSFSDSFEPPVGMYLDDVYVGSGVGQSMQIFDLDRVEVLRGPQGTLFGRNTTGGLFSITTKRPTKDAELNINAQYSSYKDVLVDVAGGGPVSDTLRLRAALRYNDSDGWSKGFFDGRRYDTANSFAFRGSAEADLNAHLKALLILNYGKADQSTPGFGITGYLDPVTGAPCDVDRIRTGACAAPSIGNLTGNDLGGFRPGRTPGQTAASFGNEPHQSVETTGASLHFEGDLGDGLTFTSISAVGETTKDYFEDLVVFSDGFSMDATQFTQEFRLNGGGKNTNWVLGAYYFKDDKELGSFDPTPVFGFRTAADQLTESWAAFGQTRIGFAENWGLTLGARYTNETKNLHYTTDFGIDERREISDGQWTGRIGLERQLTPATMLYANASSGYKSGGFNAQFVFSRDGVNPVSPETILSYETGLKSRFWDGKGRFSAAAFYYDYSDVQLGLFVPLPSGGFATRLRNAGDVIGYGAEAELQLYPTKQLYISLGAGLIETEFQDSARINSAGVIYELKGHGLPMTPPVSLNGLVRYSVPVGEGEIWGQIDGNWRDKHFFTTDQSDREGSEAYGLLNIRAGWDAPGGKYSVEAFVENVTDQKYLLFAADQVSDLGAVTWGKPLWTGIVLRARY